MFFDVEERKKLLSENGLNHIIYQIRISEKRSLMWILSRQLQIPIFNKLEILLDGNTFS